MHSHLESGCEQCSSDFAAWTRVNDLAIRERQLEPPLAALKMAKAAIKLHAEPPRLPAAKLLFDSFSVPALAGVRSAEKRVRQTLYGFDDYRVDLRFEPDFDADQTLLVGQILKSGSAVHNSENITVSLVRGAQVLGAAKANEFGEFQLECDLGGRLELQLTLPDGAKLRVPMVEPTAGEEKPSGMKVLHKKALTPQPRNKGKGTRKGV
jgi:hypothetical protein